MEARDLMIGDLIYITDKKIVKVVVEISSESVAVGNTLTSGYHYESYDKISAIPLTEEILEKWGFELNSHDRWQHEIFNVALSQRDNFFFIWEHIQLDSVNEAQHAFRLVGLNKLADSLKFN